MVEQARPEDALLARNAIESCWMCGTRCGGPRQPLVRRTTPAPGPRPARGAAAVPGTASSR
jgi:hypothetical protein